MQQLEIIGGKKLTGNVRISGAKNSAVALIPAAILADDLVSIYNVPNISDIDSLSEILSFLGATVEREKETITIDSSSIINKFHHHLLHHEF
jgi:UDP-N-acetylglucosamine 1-carboxyvinyltransferase